MDEIDAASWQADIDVLERERDEARAEVERLREQDARLGLAASVARAERAEAQARNLAEVVALLRGDDAFARAERAEAGLAALRETVDALHDACCNMRSFLGTSAQRESLCVAMEAAEAAVTDTAAAAEAYTRRVRAELDAVRAERDDYAERALGEAAAAQHHAAVGVELQARAERAEAGLRKINEIRNSIVGAQTVNFSEHIYPLVAALDEAGAQGMPYPEARENVGTLIDRAERAEAGLVALREAARAVVHVAVVPYTDRGNALLRAYDAVITDTAAAAEAYTRRVEAKALREAADEMEARLRSISVGPGHGPRETVLVWDAIAKIRARAAEIEGGR